MNNYTITATSGDGSTKYVSVPASEVNGSTPLNVGGFTVCTRAYTFTVAPEIIEENGPRTGSPRVNTEIPGTTSVPLSRQT